MSLASNSRSSTFVGGALGRFLALTAFFGFSTRPLTVAFFFSGVSACLPDDLLVATMAACGWANVLLSHRMSQENTLKVFDECSWIRRAKVGLLLHVGRV